MLQCKRLLHKISEVNEDLWQLPITDEFREDIKGTFSDLRNIGKSHYGGCGKAAAFLENFIEINSKDKLPLTKWAHLDIAG